MYIVAGRSIDGGHCASRVHVLCVHASCISLDMYAQVLWHSVAVGARCTAVNLALIHTLYSQLPAPLGCCSLQSAPHRQQQLQQQLRQPALLLPKAQTQPAGHLVTALVSSGRCSSAGPLSACLLCSELLPHRQQQSSECRGQLQRNNVLCGCKHGGVPACCQLASPCWAAVISRQEECCAANSTIAQHITCLPWQNDTVCTSSPTPAGQYGRQQPLSDTRLCTPARRCSHRQNLGVDDRTGSVLQSLQQLLGLSGLLQAAVSGAAAKAAELSEHMPDEATRQAAAGPNWLSGERPRAAWGQIAEVGLGAAAELNRDSVWVEAGLCAVVTSSMPGVLHSCSLARQQQSSTCVIRPRSRLLQALAG
jgi:hypothetical protein